MILITLYFKPVLNTKIWNIDRQQISIKQSELDWLSNEDLKTFRIILILEGRAKLAGSDSIFAYSELK